MTRTIGSWAFDEPKKKRSITLTDTAWQWLAERGGSSYIERIVRLFIKIEARKNEKK